MLSMPGRNVTTFDLLAPKSTIPTAAAISRDGRWLAYSVGVGGGGSDDSTGIYVQPIPPTGAHFQISTKDGQEHDPVWLADGKELMFVGLPGTLWAVDITTQPAFAFGPPQARPRTFPLAAPTTPRTFDLLSDGRVIGATVSTIGTTVYTASQQISVVTNWFEELKARVK
jgi:hypothetical protein